MKSLRTIAIFGCGSAGRRACLHYKSKYSITAFLDNDRNKHGSVVDGVPVCDPEEFDYDSVEHVFIASMYLDQILVQLLALRVSSSKIDYVSDQILMQDGPQRDRLGLLHFAHELQRALYVPFRLLR
jgi:FlaA1/EpsC-like NDP-sugar epimerase